MPLMKMDLRCPSTPVVPWQALGVLLPRGDLPWALQWSLPSVLPQGSLVVYLLFLGGSEELDGVCGEWWLLHAIRVPHT
jgi:hypothetical protein